jgi:GAF domain-containing protein
MATFAVSPEFDAFIRGRLLPVTRQNVAGRTALEGKVVQVADIASDPEFNLPESVTIGKLRTVLGVPLLREGSAVGVITLGRERVQRFNDSQIDLVRTFADQAVIAIRMPG